MRELCQIGFGGALSALWGLGRPGCSSSSLPACLHKLADALAGLMTMTAFLWYFGVMRIEGPRSTDSVKKADKTKKSSGSNGVFSSFLADEADSAPAASPMSSPAGLGSILAAQYGEDPAEKQAKKRMQERASKVLDTLDVIQRGLVAGQISHSDINAIKTSVTANREKINDPRLLAIMDEVDLRAQVELAKLEVARDKKS